MTDSELVSVDLTNCDREPIHLLGRVQSFGCLIGLTSDWIISHATENVADLLGVTAVDMVGRRFQDFFSAETTHTLRNQLSFLHGSQAVDTLVCLDLGPRPGGDRFDAALHVTRETLILELMPHLKSEQPVETVFSIVRGLVGRLASLSDVDKVCAEAVRAVKLFTGYDRVMFYRFLPDGSGEVAAEAREADMEPFLNLRYPATDIPRQARALYVRNTIRQIADVGESGSPVYPVRGPDGQPLDLSDSLLRSVSEIHLEYLRNMGVGASMSISVVVDGALWGLIACHHRTAKVLGPARYQGAHLFGQMLSLVLQTKLVQAERRYDERVRDLTNALSRFVSPTDPVPEIVLKYADAFMELLQAQGAAVVLEDVVLKVGMTPSSEEILHICRVLNGAAASRIFATHHLAQVAPRAADFVERAAGVLAVPVSRVPRDYILFFRREVVKKVTWAGNPEKPAQLGPNGIRLTPRKSFEAWQSTVAGQSEEWSAADLRMAEQVRVTLLEVVLRLTDETARVRKAATEKQELLIAELNHRVRNILGVVRGLITQTGWSEHTAQSFSAVLDSRVQALARAHDQITRDNWAPVSLRRLVQVEAESFLLDKKDRILVEGDEAALQPQAFSAMALVVHELMTNAAKYGALADQHGQVTVTLRRQHDGSLTVTWRERGGPAVRAPSRRGFGSTVIERTVPFELQGTADVNYRLAGVEAEFWLPAACIAPVEAAAWQAGEEAPPVARSPIAAVADLPPLGHVLVLEDNLIIAMDAEAAFLTLGAEAVTLTATQAQAAQVLAEKGCDFALLDINLGSETSFGFAETLQAAGVPFAFASGYGDSAEFPARLQAVPCIAKPYDAEVIGDLLRRQLGHKQA